MNLFQSPEISGYFFKLVIGTALLIVLIIILIIMSKRAKSRSASSSMPAFSMHSVTQMHKKGLISDEEFKAVRKKMAMREMERMEREARGAQTLEETLAEVLKEKESRGAQQQPGEGEKESQKLPDEAVSVDKEAEIPEKKPRKAEISLENLLEKGIISREEYERMSTEFEKDES